MKTIVYFIASLIVASMATSCEESGGGCVLYVEHFTYRNETGHQFTVFDYGHDYSGKLISRAEHFGIDEERTFNDYWFVGADSLRITFMDKDSSVVFHPDDDNVQGNPLIRDNYKRTGEYRYEFTFK
jgi:hypothetical protein